jgi:hypothetical protein
MELKLTKEEVEHAKMPTIIKQDIKAGGGRDLMAGEFICDWLSLYEMNIRLIEDANNLADQLEVWANLYPLFVAKATLEKHKILISEATRV